VRAYQSFVDLPEPVRAAVIVLPPSRGVQAVRDAIATGVTKIWLQQGAESPEVVAACREAGVEPIVGECILMFEHPAGIHRVHHWVRGVFHRLPA
jgi:predicted CoA-binding protein